MMMTKSQVRLDDLIVSIREHLQYQGADNALIEKVDDNRIMITLEG